MVVRKIQVPAHIRALEGIVGSARIEAAGETWVLEYARLGATVGLSAGLTDAYLSQDTRFIVRLDAPGVRHIVYRGNDNFQARDSYVLLAQLLGAEHRRSWPRPFEGTAPIIEMAQPSLAVAIALEQLPPPVLSVVVPGDGMKPLETVLGSFATKRLGPLADMVRIEFDHGRFLFRINSERPGVSGSGARGYYPSGSAR